MLSCPGSGRQARHRPMWSTAGRSCGQLDIQFAVSVVVREDRLILPAVEVGRGMSGSGTMVATLSIGEDSAVEVGLVTDDAPDEGAATDGLALAGVSAAASAGVSQAAQPGWVQATEAAIGAGVVWERLPRLQPFVDEVLALIGSSFPDLVGLVEPGLQNWATEPATVALVAQLLRDRTKPGQPSRPRTIVRVATRPGLVNRQLTIEVTGRLSDPRRIGSANSVHRSGLGWGSSDTRTAGTSRVGYTKAQVWTWQIHDFRSPHTSTVTGAGSWRVGAGQVAGESQTKQRKTSVEWEARPVNVAYTLELAATVWVDSALSPVLDLMTAGVAQRRVRLDVPATKSKGGFFTVQGDVVVGVDPDRLDRELATAQMEPGEVTAVTTRPWTTADRQPQRSGYAFGEADFRMGEVQSLWFNGLDDLLRATSDAFFGEDLRRTTTAAFTSPQGLKDSLAFLLDQRQLGANFPDLVLDAITRAVHLPTWTLTDALGTLSISLDVTSIHPLGPAAPNLTFSENSRQGTTTTVGTQNANDTELSPWGLVDSQAAGNAVAASPFVDILRSQNRQNIAESSSSSQHGVERMVELQDVEAGLTWRLVWAPGDGAAPTLLEVGVPTGNRLRTTPKLLARLLGQGVRDSSQTWPAEGPIAAVRPRQLLAANSSSTVRRTDGAHQSTHFWLGVAPDPALANGLPLVRRRWGLCMAMGCAAPCRRSMGRGWKASWIRAVRTSPRYPRYCCSLVAKPRRMSLLNGTRSPRGRAHSRCMSARTGRETSCCW